MDNVPDFVRETCDRYGTQVIGKMLSEGFNPSTSDLKTIYATDEAKLQARDWLTETSDIQEYRERWIPLRDLVLEIFVIVLIGIEIWFSWQGEKQQATNFTAQQQVLTNLAGNTKTTSDTLNNLYKATTQLNDLMKQELDQNTRSARASAKSAKASEASSKTAIDALHISERASITLSGKLDAALKVGEVAHFTVVARNTGKTSASAAVLLSGCIATPVGTALQSAHDEVFKKSPETISKAILGAGEQVEQKWSSPFNLSEADETMIKNQTYRFYLFSETTYIDAYGATHHTHYCGFYDVSQSAFVNCSELNTAD